MSTHTWLLFALTEAVMSLTPGPAVMLVLSQGLKRGARGALWSNLGILTGNGVYFALSAAGLGAVLLASYDVFFAIKWLGAAYLVYMGVAALLSRPAPLPLPGTTPPIAVVGRGRTLLSRFAERPLFALWTNRVSGLLLIGAGVGVASVRKE